MKRILLLLCCSMLVCQQNFAQEFGREKNQQGSDAEVQNSFWTGNFAGGQIMIPVNKIAAIAQHKYLLDGQFMIYEVTIDVVGNSLTRIYYIEPVAATVANSTNLGAAASNRAREIGAGIKERTGTSDIDPETTVTKNYPSTTHSHTIEYRVATLDEINGVYKSLSTAVQRNKGRTYSYKQ